MPDKLIISYEEYKKVVEKLALEIEKKYGEKAVPVIKSYGGKPVVRGGKLKSFSGPNVVRTVIWEFPTYNNAISCHESTEYKSAWTHAEDTTKRIMFIVEGVE